MRLLGGEVLESRRLEPLGDRSTGLGPKRRKLTATSLLRRSVEKLLSSQAELLWLLLCLLLWTKLLLSQVEPLLLLCKLPLLLQLLSRELDLIELLVGSTVELPRFPLLLVDSLDDLTKVGLPGKPGFVPPYKVSLHTVLISQLGERERGQRVSLWQFERIVHLVVLVLLVIHISTRTRTRESGPKFRIAHSKVVRPTWSTWSIWS